MNTEACVEQAIRIIEAGGKLVRITAPGVKEARNLENIHAELRRRGYTTPLSADIHFNPEAAIEAAKHVEKVRINPGNFVDKRATFKTLTYTDEEYAAELERLREKFSAFLNVCREYGTAVRIGTNHGSLSDRIMSRYGNTPAGMVEATMEYLRVCRDEKFDDVVISLKSSDCRVMVEAVRLLVKEMEKEGMDYPLHLGVTEAGEGEDGRIRSAVGIGTLLNEGLGDTIRVSLTEEPEQESVAPDLGTYKELLEVLQTLQTLEDWKSSPEYEMITAQKEKVLSQLIRSFYHGQDSLSLRDTAWGDRDLPGMAFEVFRSLLGSEDLEREAETPLEWFRTWFIWAFGHIHEADAEGLQAQYPASYAAIYSLMDHHDTWENSVTANLDRVGQYDFDLYAARDQIVSYIRKNEEIWPFSYTLILRASSAPYGAERQTPGDPNLYVDFIWWRVCDGGLREYFVVQELTLNPETGESSVWTVPRKDGEMELHNIPDWVVDTLFED